MLLELLNKKKKLWHFPFPISFLIQDSSSFPQTSQTEITIYVEDQRQLQNPQKKFKLFSFHKHAK